MPLPSNGLAPEGLAETLAGKFRISLSGETGGTGDSDVIVIRATDIPKPNGFSIEVRFGWKSIEAVFVPDTYAGDLIRTMGNAPAAVRQQFLQLAETFTGLGNRIELRINDTAVKNLAALPEPEWAKFEVKVRRLTDATSVGGEPLQQSAEEVSAACLSLVLSLLPLEEEESGDVPMYESGLPEGASSKVTVNRYERNPANRAACLAVHGLSCKACGFSFGQFYGELGMGYIEVHHIVPVSKMGPGYLVNPAKDLVPLCSNCHSVVHRTDPPLAVEVVRKLVETKRQEKLGICS